MVRLAAQMTVPLLDDGDLALYLGDAALVLRGLPAGIAQTCVTSPPYWGLRDYGAAGQLGLESSPVAYVAALVDVLDEVARVLRPDGTLWLNLGDSYAASGPAVSDGLKPKDLVGIPWRVAFALQDAGWYLRSDVIWSKPNPMPESVTDRPTKSHEYLFLLARQPRYYYDAAAIREPATYYRPNGKDGSRPDSPHAGQFIRRSGNQARKPNPAGQVGTSDQAHSIPWEGFERNKRTVWEVPTRPLADAHFATFPEALVRPCILAGSRPGDLVIDPFVGSGTTALVARKHGRRAIGIDLNADYLAIAARRTSQLSLFA